jgi:hypothetical protein
MRLKHIVPLIALLICVHVSTCTAVYSGTEGWFMDTKYGSLCGNGKANQDDCGEVHRGQVLTMQVDMTQGSLKFWRDGRQHGPGFPCGVCPSRTSDTASGMLRWAVSAGNIKYFN